MCNCCFTLASMLIISILPMNYYEETLVVMKMTVNALKLVLFLTLYFFNYF